MFGCFSISEVQVALVFKLGRHDIATSLAIEGSNNTVLDVYIPSND